MVTSNNARLHANPAEKRKPVRWNPQERQQVAEAGAKAFRNGEVSHPLGALHAGQAFLPKDRQRPSVHTVGENSSDAWFRPMFTEELRKLREAEERQKIEEAKEVERAKLAAALAQATPPTEPQAVAETVHMNGHAHNGHNGHAYDVETANTGRDNPAPAPANRLGEAFVNLRALLVDELASIFVEAGLKAIGSSHFGEQYVQLTKPTEEVPGRVVFKRSVGAPRKPDILVVGLKGGQKTEIQRDYGAHFDLRFIGSDESKDQLRSMTEKASTTIVMTDFIGHSHEDIVKARSSHYLRQSGVITQLRETLAGLAH